VTLLHLKRRPLTPLTPRSSCPYSQTHTDVVTTHIHVQGCTHVYVYDSVRWVTERWIERDRVRERDTCAPGLIISAVALLYFIYRKLVARRNACIPHTHRTTTAMGVRRRTYGDGARQPGRKPKLISCTAWWRRQRRT
jgi:hypothetical protein